MDIYGYYRIKTGAKLIVCRDLTAGHIVVVKRTINLPWGAGTALVTMTAKAAITTQTSCMFADVLILSDAVDQCSCGHCQWNGWLLGLVETWTPVTAPSLCLVLGHNNGLLWPLLWSWSQVMDRGGGLKKIFDQGRDRLKLLRMIF